MKPQRTGLFSIFLLGLLIAAPAAETVQVVPLPPIVDWSVPQTRPKAPSGVNYLLMDQVQSKPASLLIAMARQARDEGRFADAIFILQTALDSPYGQDSFRRDLKAAINATNQRMNKEARGPLYEQGFSFPEKGDILIVSLFPAEKNPTMGTWRARIEISSLMSKAFNEKWRLLLLQRVSVVLKSEMDRLIPGNLLEYKNNHQQFFIEGHFNAEYPGVVSATNLELGLLYKDTQDFVLARHHLEASLSQKAFLSSRELEYQVRYALAEIQVIEGKIYDYEKTLKGICVDDRDFTSQDSSIANRRHQMVDVLLTDPAGLDKVIELYRLPDDFSLSAHRQLGTMYLQRKNFEGALPHLIFAVLKPVSHAMSEIRDRQYGYAYTTMADFLATARQYPDIMAYLQEAGLFNSLFCLSETVMGYKPNYLRLPRQIWTTLAQAREAGVVQPQAAAYLKRFK